MWYIIIQRVTEQTMSVISTSIIKNVLNNQVVTSRKVSKSRRERREDMFGWQEEIVKLECDHYEVSFFQFLVYNVHIGSGKFWKFWKVLISFHHGLRTRLAKTIWLDNSQKGSESAVGREPLIKMKLFLLYQSPYRVFVTLWIVKGHCSYCRDGNARPRGLMIARGYIVSMRSKICAWIPWL